MGSAEEGVKQFITRSYQIAWKWLKSGLNPVEICPVEIRLIPSDPMCVRLHLAGTKLRKDSLKRFLESTLPSFRLAYKIQEKEATVTVGGCGGFGRDG